MYFDPTQSPHPLRAIPVADQHLRQWQDELVIYDQRCGETHLLHGPAAAIFLMLRDAPCGMGDLVCRLESEEFQELEDPDFFAHRVVRELHRLQLIEQDPSTRE